MRVPLLGRGESREDREARKEAKLRAASERKAYERWADVELKRVHREYRGLYGASYWKAGEKRLRELLKSPDQMAQPVLVRVYEHNDAKKAIRMFEIEANILAQRSFVPVSQAWSSVKPSTLLLGGIGLLAPHTLTVTYRREAPPATS